MTEHEEIQHDLPAYAASRLEGPALVRLERHVRDCAECLEMLDTFAGIAEAIGRDGEDLFAPHPSETALREFAGRPSGARSDDVARHVAGCAACALEAEFWSRRPAGAAPARRASRRPSWGSLGLASAAALAAGFLLAAFLGPGGRPPAPSGGSAGGPETEAGIEAGRLLVLPRALRGEGSVVSYRLDTKQAFVVIASPAPIPGAAGPGERYLFEIARGGEAAAWSRSMTAAEIRGRMTEGAEFVTLLVPARALAPGRYEFRLRPAAGGGEPIYRAVLDLAGGEAAR